MAFDCLDMPVSWLQSFGGVKLPLKVAKPLKLCSSPIVHTLKKTLCGMCNVYAYSRCMKWALPIIWLVITFLFNQ